MDDKVVRPVVFLHSDNCDIMALHDVILKSGELTDEERIKVLSLRDQLTDGRYTNWLPLYVRDESDSVVDIGMDMKELKKRLAIMEVKLDD